MANNKDTPKIQNQFRWNDAEAIRRSLGTLLNHYIAGNLSADKLRNATYCARTLLECCKVITGEELAEIKEMLEAVEQEVLENERKRDFKLSSYGRTKKTS